MKRVVSLKAKHVSTNRTVLNLCLVPRDFRRASRRFFSSSSLVARIDFTAGMNADYETVSIFLAPVHRT